MKAANGIFLVLLSVIAKGQSSAEDEMEPALENRGQLLANEENPAHSLSKRTVISPKLENLNDLDLDEILNKRNFQYAGIGKRNFKYAGVGKRNFKYAGVGKRNFRYAGVGKRENYVPEAEDNQALYDDTDKRGSMQYIGVGKRQEFSNEDKRDGYGFRYAGVGKRGSFKYAGIGKRDNFRYASVGKREDLEKPDLLDESKRTASFKYSSLGKRYDNFKYAGVGKRSKNFMYTGVGKRDTDSLQAHELQKRNVGDAGTDKLAKRLGYAYMYPSVGKRNNFYRSRIASKKNYKVRPRSSSHIQPRTTFRFQGIGKRDDEQDNAWKYSTIGNRSQKLNNLIDILRSETPYDENSFGNNDSYEV